MSDGGDWLSEDSEDEQTAGEVEVPQHLDAVVSKASTPAPAPAAPQRKRFLPVLLVMSLLGAALGASVIMRAQVHLVEEAKTDALQPERDHRAEEWERDRRERAEAQLARKNASSLVGELQPQLREVWRDFDFDARDANAATMVSLAQHTPNISATEFHIAGATDALMQLPQFSGKGWGRYLMRHERWDAAQNLDSTKVRGLWVTAGLCAAGQQATAMTRLKDDLATPETLDLALACAPTDGEIIAKVNKSRLTDAQTGIIATRNTEQVDRAYEDFKVIGANQDSPSLLALTARQFLQDRVQRSDMVRIAATTVFGCTDLPVGRTAIAELPPSEVFQQVVEKLGPDTDATALDNLNTAVVRAGVLRMKDTRGYEPTSTANQLCVAQAEYLFEPARAVQRLTNIVAASDNKDAKALEMLAMAKARVGDFEGAYQAATQLNLLRASPRGTTHWMLFAFAHLAEREVDVTPTRRDRYIGMWQAAYEGSERMKQAYRMDFREPGVSLPVSFYLRALLAPGHEEAFLDAQLAEGASLAHYTFARAEAARWRKDAAAEKVWNERLERQFARFGDGEFGGLYMLWTPPR